MDDDIKHDAHVAAPAQSITSHTTNTSSSVGQKRQREDTPEAPSNRLGGQSGLPARPNDVRALRRPSHTGKSCRRLCARRKQTFPFVLCSCSARASRAACYVFAVSGQFSSPGSQSLLSSMMLIVTHLCCSSSVSLLSWHPLRCRILRYVTAMECRILRCHSPRP